MGNVDNQGLIVVNLLQNILSPLSLFRVFPSGDLRTLIKAPASGGAGCSANNIEKQMLGAKFSRR